MSKDSSAKYYQDNKERLQKKLMKDIKSFFKDIKSRKVFLKKKKKTSNSMVMNDTKTYQKKKNKIWLSIEKNITK